MRMPQFSFIHAADLHLGAPFRGLDATASGEFSSSRQGGNLLAESGFEALKRLEDACLRHKAAFLILSGDIYDDADGVLRARFALRDMFLRLRAAGVRVFIVHGNHDPFKPGPLPVAWPDNVTVFGDDAGCACVTRDGRPVALVHGISHASAGETENLALRFKRYTPGSEEARFADIPENVPENVFQIAVLHCAAGGAAEGHAPYAPCALSDLTCAGFDYWALGHVHQGRVLCEAPWVVYPGSIQGLHINETGPHGCCLARVAEGGCTVERLSLAPVTWGKIRIDLSGHEEVDTVDGLEEAIVAALEDAADGTEGTAEETRAVFCRVTLEGQTGLDGILRRPGTLEILLERVRKELAASTAKTRVWVKDIMPATSPVRDFGALAGRDDLVGEIVRMADALRADPDRTKAFDDAAKAGLYGNAKVKKALDLVAREADVAGLLADEARALLCSLLEGGE